MKKVLNNKKGFTLIELIVVIAIIAILAAIAIPTFSGVMDDAKKADTVSMARNAYTLAKVEVLNAVIDGTAIPSESDLATAVKDDAGLTGSDTLVIKLADDEVTAATVTANGWEATINATGTHVTED